MPKDLYAELERWDKLSFLRQQGLPLPKE